ncbi:MAG: four helix bundle protein [Bacteroidetes bacterium]|nr:four helix bundle protein [Bacteroidota bacterium]
MNKTKTFSELIVWQKAQQLTLNIYKMTEDFPKKEIYGLTSQMRRSAVSIPANIAEGYRKRGKLDKARFFNISQGSLEELKYYLILAKDLDYIEENLLEDLTTEVGKLLNSYMKAILNSNS